MKIAILQMNSGRDKQVNLDQISELFCQAVADGPVDLVIAPEYSTFLDGCPDQQRSAAECFPTGSSYRTLRAIAQKHDTPFHIGSMLEQHAGSTFNTSVIFDGNGNELARYRKIHLFDVETPDGHSFRESSVITGGKSVEQFELSGHRFGCAICYDLRFAELFHEHMRAGCEVMALPAAFNRATGEDHWEVLCRARAIETQSYFVAAGQAGAHQEAGGTALCYGNSMVVDPWGKVVARGGDGVGVVFANLDFAKLSSIRQNFPTNRHHVL